MGDDIYLFISNVKIFLLKVGALNLHGRLDSHNQSTLTPKGNILNSIRCMEQVFCLVAETNPSSAPSPSFLILQTLGSNGNGTSI